MAMLVPTRSGYDDLIRTLGRVPPQLWLNAGILSEEEIAALHAAGHDVTHFADEIPVTDVAAIERALHIVRQHHAVQRVWVEFPPLPPRHGT